jgi:hypothetical protein
MTLIYWNTIHNYLHKKLNLEIERRASITLADYLEKQIKTLVDQIGNMHNQLNIQREKQKIYTKKRIDKDCVEEVIKNISLENIIELPEKAGGNKKEKRKKNLQSPERNLTEEYIT